MALKESLLCPPVRVKRSPVHGYGVFAARDIQAGELIEEAPVLLTPVRVSDPLFDYIFSWGDSKDVYALVLGYGSLYNHSETPATYYEKDIDAQTWRLFAKQDIGKDEEIFIYYSKDWFKSRNIIDANSIQEHGGVTTEVVTTDKHLHLSIILYALLVLGFVVWLIFG